MISQEIPFSVKLYGLTDLWKARGFSQGYAQSLVLSGDTVKSVVLANFLIKFYEVQHYNTCIGIENFDLHAWSSAVFRKDTQLVNISLGAWYLVILEHGIGCNSLST